MTLVAVSTVSALVAACTPSTPAPSPSPTPTPSASSAAQTETEFQKQEREAYEGAEKAYRTFRAEYNREITSTHEPHVTAKMRATAGGTYLKRYSQFLKTRRVQNVRSTSGVKVASVEHSAYKPGMVTLKTCEDGTRSRLVNKAGNTIGRGTASRLEISVRVVGGVWKVWDGNEAGAVKSCRV